MSSGFGWVGIVGVGRRTFRGTTPPGTVGIVRVYFLIPALVGVEYSYCSIALVSFHRSILALSRLQLSAADPDLLRPVPWLQYLRTVGHEYEYCTVQVVALYGGRVFNALAKEVQEGKTTDC